MSKKTTNWTLEDLKNKNLIANGKDSFIPSNKANTTHFGQTKVVSPANNLDSRDQAIVDFFDSYDKKVTVFEIDPIGAPRMTQSDKWKTDPFHKDPKKRQRKCVTQYFKTKNELISQAEKKGFAVPENGAHITFILPMSHSWSEKKKSLMNGSPHKFKPDCDNICKFFLDSLCKSDAHIWDVRITKLWGIAGKIIITV